MIDADIGSLRRNIATMMKTKKYFKKIIYFIPYIGIEINFFCRMA